MIDNTRNTSVRTDTFSDIPSMFPDVYREDGAVLVEFVKSYYEFHDTQMNDFRDGYNIRDVDTTYERFLSFFKKKYLSEIPISDPTDTRFVIKHIQDLYRRKGSEESLRLLFKLFFNEDIEVVYPSNNILRVSDSKYSSSQYLEMKPTTTFKSYPIIKGDVIYGDTTKSTAVVDKIIFRNYRGSYEPILFLTRLSGKFSFHDSITITRQSQIAGDKQTLFPGKIIKGSIGKIVIDKSKKRATGNGVGDALEVKSSKSGEMCTVAVSDISEATTGTIEFVLSDPGYGYSADSSVNNITISNQVLSIVNSANAILPGDVISAVGVLSSDGVTVVDGVGSVVEYDSDQGLLYINVDDQSSAFTTIPMLSTVELENVSQTTTITATSASLFNDYASFEVGSIDNQETVSIFVDPIEDYLDIALDSSDYGMTGPTQETLDTPISDSFIPQDVTIGEIRSLKILDTGVDYTNDVKVAVEQQQISEFDLRSVGIVFDRSDFILRRGDTITQEITIEDLSYVASTKQYTVKGSFDRRHGNIFYFVMKSFYGFDNDYPVDIRNNQYTIQSITIDEESSPMGANGVVTGSAIFASGQIKSVSISESGFRYQDGETVELLSSTGEVVAYGVVELEGTGYVKGSWTTTTSLLNEKTRVIRDNDYYQEYSYEVLSIVPPSKYEELVSELVQVAGTKQFSSPIINSTSTVISVVDATITSTIGDVTTTIY